MINYTATPIHLQQAGWLIDALKQGVFSVYDTILAELFLEVAVGILMLALVIGWLWLALNWLTKKHNPPGRRSLSA